MKLRSEVHSLCVSSMQGREPNCRKSGIMCLVSMLMRRRKSGVMTMTCALKRSSDCICRICLGPMMKSESFFSRYSFSRLAFGAYADDKGIEASRKPEDLHLGGTVGGDAFAQQAGAFFAAGHSDQLAEGEARDRSFCGFTVHGVT